MFERLLAKVKKRSARDARHSKTAAEAAAANSDPAQPTETGGSLLLQLPTEIRRLILLEAFGNQTIHIDKRFGYDVMSRAEPNSHQSRKGWKKAKQAQNSEGNTHCGITVPSRRDTSKPKAWCWFSCVCHRPRKLPPKEYYISSTGRVQPGDDDCLWFGKGCVCVPGENHDGRTAVSPRDCFLGVSGWLQSCKLAYTEGIEILLSTNTIHLSSQYLIENLALEIPIGQRALIRSLEIVLDHGACDGAFSEEIPYTRSIWTIWDDLPQSCHALRKLHITIYGFKEPRDTIDNPRSRVARNVLTPLDSLRLALPEAMEMTVSFERSAYAALESMYRKIYSCEGMECDPRNMREGLEGQVQDPRTFKKRINGSNNKYYWIEDGFRWPVMFVCTMGMGRGDEPDLWDQKGDITEDPVDLSQKTAILSAE